MKKLVSTLCLSALAASAFAQGTVNFNNTTTTLVSTNSTARGGSSGPAANAPGGYYYGLFTAASTVTSIDSALDLLTPTWTFTGIYATNTLLASGGRFNGGAGVATLTGWAPGSTNSYAILGWSGNLGQQNWAALQSFLQGGSFGGGTYVLPNAPGSADGSGFLGVSSRGFAQAGGGPAGLPAPNLFGAVPTAQGTPISTGFSLFVVTVPEPSTFALAGLGAAALLIFRRRK